MTISTPEPGELVKTVSELVAAVNAGSGDSVPNVQLSASGSGASVLVLGGGIASGMTNDFTIGTGITLNADGETIDITVDGLYYIQAYAAFDPVNITAAFASFLTTGAIQPVDTPGPGFAPIGVGFEQGMPITMMFRVAGGPGHLQIAFGIRGVNGVATSYGFDCFRVA